MVDNSLLHQAVFAFSPITREHVRDDEVGSRFSTDELLHVKFLLYFIPTLQYLLSSGYERCLASQPPFDKAFAFPKYITGQSRERSPRCLLLLCSEQTTKRPRCLRTRDVPTPSTWPIDTLEAGSTSFVSYNHLEKRHPQATTVFAHLVAKTQRYARRVPSILLDLPKKLHAYVKSVPQDQQWSQQGPRKRVRKSPLSSSETTQAQSNTPCKPAASKQGPQVKFGVFSKNPLASAQLGCFVGKVNGELPQCQGPKCHWKCARTLSRSPHLKRHVDDGNITAAQLELVKDVATRSLKDKPEEAWRKCLVCLYPEFKHLKEQLNPYHGEPLLQGVANPRRHVATQQNNLRVPIRGSHYTGQLASEVPGSRSNTGLGIQPTQAGSNSLARGPWQSHPATPPRRFESPPRLTRPTMPRPAASNGPHPSPMGHAGADGGWPSLPNSNPPHPGRMPSFCHTSPQQSFAARVQASSNAASHFTSPLSPRRVTQLNAQINAANGYHTQYRSPQATSTESQSLTTDDSPFPDDSSSHLAITPSRDSRTTFDQYLLQDLSNGNVGATDDAHDTTSLNQDLEKILLADGSAPTGRVVGQAAQQYINRQRVYGQPPPLYINPQQEDGRSLPQYIDPQLLSLTPAAPTRANSEYSSSRKRPASKSPPPNG